MRQPDDETGGLLDGMAGTLIAVEHYLRAGPLDDAERAALAQSVADAVNRYRAYTERRRDSADSHGL